MTKTDTPVKWIEGTVTDADEHYLLGTYHIGMDEYEKGLYWLTEAYKAGHLRAGYYIASCLLMGGDVAQGPV